MSKELHLVRSERDELENSSLRIRDFFVDVHVQDVARVVADAQADDEARRVSHGTDGHSDLGIFDLKNISFIHHNKYSFGLDS